VRILRVARFAARFAEFTIAAETVELMRQMVANGEVDHLVPERVWQELARGLMEARPSRMLETLWLCGALARILPEIEVLFGVPQPADYHPERDTGVHVLLVVDHAARRGYPLPVRFAALTHDLGKGLTPADEWPFHHGHEEGSEDLVEGICRRLKVPNDCRELAVLAAREHGNVHRAEELRPNTIVTLIMRCDGLRRPERFAQLLDACACDFHGRPGYENRVYRPREILLSALAALQAIDAGAIAAACKDKSLIPARLHEARVHAVRAQRE
jgi:tRNA nucleotidyltransferase (CCA-adding enzyme)